MITSADTAFFFQLDSPERLITSTGTMQNENQLSMKAANRFDAAVTRNVHPNVARRGADRY